MFGMQIPIGQSRFTRMGSKSKICNLFNLEMYGLLTII